MSAATRLITRITPRLTATLVAAVLAAPTFAVGTLAVGTAAAQTAATSPATSPATSQPAPKRIVPGDSTLRPARLHSDTLTYELVGFREGQVVPVGTIRDELTLEVGPPPQLRREIVVQRGSARLIDSSLTDVATMAPRRHVSRQPQRDIQLNIVGRRVRGTIGPSGTPGAAIDTTLGSMVFDAASWDLLVRTMPLARDYAAVFRVWDIETGLRDYTVRVIGSTPLRGETAWILLLQLGGPREITVWIGQTTSRLLQVETPVNETTVLRQSLISPAR